MSKTKKKISSSEIEGGFIDYTITQVKDLFYEYKSIEYINESTDVAYHIEGGVIDKEKLEILFQHKVAFHPEDNVISIYLTITFLYNGQLMLLRYALKIDFAVDNYKEVVVNRKGKATLSDQFLTSFFGIAISTARGLLIAHLKGTDYEDIHIPFFYPSQIREQFVNQYL